MWENAILLPPPAKHSVTNRILESLEGSESAPLTKREKSSDFLPPLELGRPRINFSSHARSPFSAHSAKVTVSDIQTPSDHAFERRSGPSRNPLHSPGKTSQFHPSRSDGSSTPYHLPPSRYPPRRPDAASSVARWPAPSPRSAPPSSYGNVASPRDIKRRRTILLDFREVTLDLLEETATVLDQLNNTLHKMTLRRKDASSMRLWAV